MSEACGDFGALFRAYPKEKRYALAILLDLQNRYNHIPKPALKELAAYLEVRVSHLYRMATFYRALSLEPKGRRVIKICDGTACHLRGTPALLDGIRRAVGVGPGETSADRRWSLETVNCLGACALAPVMVVDGVYYPKVRTEEVGAILRNIEDSGDPIEETGETGETGKT
ncbi:MAG: NAD(P)H-dependent oxidoreductase subunit E [Spirochaetaceae bacterium]|nr:NAD(P)H-dependent oxidoreductase subunit E [Spirochaetaceae bacterium]